MFLSITLIFPTLHAIISLNVLFLVIVWDFLICVCLYLFTGAYVRVFICVCKSMCRPENNARSSVTLHLVYPGRV